MHIDPQLIVHQTTHWIVNHRINSHLPGYLMLGARANVNELHELPAEALAELGALMAHTQQVMQSQLQPKRLYIGRYGHTPDQPIHFHFIPVFDWVENLFWQDPRYRLLQGFGAPNPQTVTDGAELTLFVWREFCERPDPPPAPGLTTEQTIERLRQAFSAG